MNPDIDFLLMIRVRFLCIPYNGLKQRGILSEIYALCHHFRVCSLRNSCML